MTGMRAIKRTVQLLAALYLLAMVLFPVGATWLEAHPESALAAGGAFANVDRQAGVFTQVRQFFTGVSKSRELIADEKLERAEDEAAAVIERKQALNRRFNTGELSGDAYSSEY